MAKRPKLKLKITTKQISNVFNITKSKMHKKFYSILFITIIYFRMNKTDKINYEGFGIIKLKKRNDKQYFEFIPDEIWQKVLKKEYLKKQNILEIIKTLL